MSRPIYVDIDGTLTHSPRKGWGEPRTDVIHAVKKAIEAGETVILWSAGGDDYCKAFAEKYGIAAHAYLTKPGVVVDDALRVRASYRMRNLAPDEFAREWQ